MLTEKAAVARADIGDSTPAPPRSAGALRVTRRNSCRTLHSATRRVAQGAVEPPQATPNTAAPSQSQTGQDRRG